VSRKQREGVCGHRKDHGGTVLGTKRAWNHFLKKNKYFEVPLWGPRTVALVENVGLGGGGITRI